MKEQKEAKAAKVGTRPSLSKKTIAKQAIGTSVFLDGQRGFVNNIAHEIRSPLQGIAFLLSTLKDKWRDLSDIEIHHHLAALEESSSSLLLLASNLLDYSKFEAGKFLQDLRQNNLLDAVDEAILQLKLLYHNSGSGINFKFEGNRENYILNFDKELIQKVVRNILTNALKYSKEKDLEISAYFVSEDGLEAPLKNAKFIQIQFKDFGLGIPNKEVEAIFLPYNQSSITARKFDGTGLGLSVCKQIIERHQGRIWAENNKSDDGATFFFTLPLEFTKDQITQDSANHNIPTSFHDDPDHFQLDNGENSAFPKYSVLFVDDEKLSILSGKMILESYGMEVEVVNNGEEAFHIASKRKFDLILLDQMLPDYYGADLVKKIRKTGLNILTPIIMQSGASDAKEIREAIDNGASSYLIKPYNKARLFEEIKKYVEI
ncbi:MAG: hybrid sensor histidine kinase/response regulator [Rickettsiaceae bacterium]|nr:hybrid sensor histidine kinase/response regulator [Rickettsiaceae bacterium]